MTTQGQNMNVWQDCGKIKHLQIVKYPYRSRGTDRTDELLKKRQFFHAPHPGHCISTSSQSFMQYHISAYAEIDWTVTTKTLPIDSEELIEDPSRSIDVLSASKTHLTNRKHSVNRNFKE